MKTSLLTFLVSVCSLVFSQKQGNIWYFGDHAGLNFNSGVPVAITNGQTFSPDPLSSIIEGTAVMSDSSGALLFYTNGNKVWNRNHQLMQNGDSLFGNFSSTQSSLILPKPGSSRYYYVFTTSDFYYQNLKYGLRYSVVDMCQSNGNGDILSGQKNILVLDTVAEKLTAVRHTNGIDYWVIVHKYYSRDFYAFLLTANGITNTVVSTIGSNHPLPAMPSISGYAIGSLKASPNGKKLAIVTANGQAIAEYFNFNTSTGLITNSVNIQVDPNYSYYGISFSPDNTKLYIAGILNNYNIFQYDLTAGNGNADSVKASRTPIAKPNFNYMGLQLHTNGKIYVCKSFSNMHLAVINQPNIKGLGCSFVDSAVYLGGKKASYGLPNFVELYDYSNNLSACTEGLNTGFSSFEDLQNTVHISPNPFINHCKVTVVDYSSLQTAELIDCQGKVQLTWKALQSNSINIERGRLLDGVYLLRLVYADKVLIRRLVVASGT